jgi:hypothetical protein
MQGAEICSAKPGSAKPDGPVSATGWCKNSRDLDDSSKSTMAEPDDWRTSLIHYLDNPGHIVGRNVRR